MQNRQQLFSATLQIVRKYFQMFPFVAYNFAAFGEAWRRGSQVSHSQMVFVMFTSGCGRSMHLSNQYFL